MRTIDKILPYIFTPEEKKILQDKGFANWCWWAKGFSFDKIFKSIIYIVKKADKFKVKKLKKLIKDFQLLCSFWHDIDFSLWWNLKDFYKANMRFIAWILALLHWSNIITRIFVFIILLLGLNILWLRFFKFRKKKLQLNDLFINL